MYSHYGQLSKTKQDKFDEKFAEIRKNVHEYGNSTNKCLRVKDINKVEVLRTQYKKYAIGFIKHWKFDPYEKCKGEDLEISHICGNPKNSQQSLCIQGSHMRLESHNENDSRCDCHKYIRKFERSWNRNNKYKINVKGILTVERVNQQKRDKLKIDPDDINWVCTHVPVCFINYGKRKKSQRGSQRIRRNRNNHNHNS